MYTPCKTCSPISHTVPRFHLDIPEDIEKQYQQVVLLWEFKLHKVVASARYGCQFCAFIAYRFFETNRMFTFGNHSHRIPTIHNEEERQTAFADALQKSKEMENDSFTLSFMPSHTRGNALPDLDKMTIDIHSCEMGEDALDKHMPYRRPITVEVYAAKGDVASKYLTTRPINTKPASPESFQQARRWIDDCFRNHANCPSMVIPDLPTRVVEVLQDNSLRLHTGGGKSSYAALSYCWGGPQTLASTVSSLSELTKGFPSSILPLTLQDAIKVVTELGLKYIWIDSLCIIQDSLSDKAKEITQMAQIYSNAYATICAANAESSSQGFLKIFGSTPENPGSSLDDDLIKMPYRAPDGEIGTMLIREEAPYHSMWEPISQRAWTLQERMLSPRNLIYGSRLIWQCNTAQHSDGGVEDWSLDVLGSGNRKFSCGAFESNNPSSTASPIDFFTLRQVFQVWYSAVQEYTRRSLTYPSDKLPAIAGMAKAFHESTGDTYLAGLWKSNLAHDLMWHTNPSYPVRYSTPEIWRAPSWSWACTDNEVSFNKLTEDSTLLAKALNCNVTPLSVDAPFGEITNAVLEIDAPFIKSELELVKRMMVDEGMAPPPKDNDGNMWNKAILNMNLIGNNVGAEEDAAPWEPHESVCCLLPFSRDWHWESDYEQRKIEETCHSGLVLEQVEDGRYKRVGAFFNQWRDWMGVGERKSVVVI